MNEEVTKRQEPTLKSENILVQKLKAVVVIIITRQESETWNRK